MSAYEFYEYRESVSPEIELESFCLFEEVQNYLKTAKNIERSANKTNCAQVILQDEYPYSEIETTFCSMATAYNSAKDVTVVINEQLAYVDGDHKQAINVEFYKGKQTDSTPALQAATAVWDLETRSYVVIAHEPHDLDDNSDTLQADYVSMRLWLRGANEVSDLN